MAHPDDAEFLCAGALIRLAAAGWEVHIATLAPGDCGSMTEDRWAISARRTAEARAAAAMIGAAYHCLDERDGLIVYDKPTLQKCFDLFRRVAPQLVFTHSPLDYMMDHVEVAQLARAASFIYGAPNISARPVREGSGVPHLYYCDALEGIDPLGQPIRPSTWLDITGQLEKKAEMLACHASQRAWLRAHHGTDEYIDAMRRHAVLRGREFGVAAAEAFVQHRGHAYPKNDLIAEL
jgi:LmbE family N-acetylglucosaminyl deacetylase